MDPMHQWDVSRIKDATTRRSLLRALAAGGAGLAFAGLSAGPTKAASDVSLERFTTLALTAEMLSVTFYSNAIAAANQLVISGADLAFLKATHAAEQDHVTVFQLLGGQPLTNTFSLPAGAATFSDRGAFVQTILALETASVGAYMTAVLLFAGGGRADLAQLAARIGSVEGEHRVLARRLAGLAPANDRSIEDNPYSSLEDLAAKVQGAGFFGPQPGNSFTYPGPVAIDASGVSYRHP